MKRLPLFGLGMLSASALVALLSALLHPPAKRRIEYVFFDRVGSNNAARVRLWIYATSSANFVRIHSTSHDEQNTEAFRRVNPQGKIPALQFATADSAKTSTLSEAAVILQYLEEEHGGGRLIPSTALARANMNLIIRTHDLYLASPNCVQPGCSTHTYGCMFIPPPGTSSGRTIERSVRAMKVAEVDHQLKVLEELADEEGPYLCGPALTLADFTVFPTLIGIDFYLPAVLGWGDALYACPKLRRWYRWILHKQPAFQSVFDEHHPRMVANNKRGGLDAIKAEALDDTFKWVYP